MKCCEEYEALLDAYADGELSGGERVREHLARCPACRSYVDELLAIRAAFPSIEDTAVPDGFAEGVMEAVRRDTARRRRRLRTGALASAACLAVLLYGFHNAVQPKSGGSDAPAAYAEQDAAGADFPAETPFRQERDFPGGDAAMADRSAEKYVTETASEECDSISAGAAPTLPDSAVRVELPADMANLLTACPPLTDETGKTCYLLSGAEYAALLDAMPGQEAAAGTFNGLETAPEEAFLVYLAEK